MKSKDNISKKTHGQTGDRGIFTVRPVPPLLFFFALGVWAGVAAAYKGAFFFTFTQSRGGMCAAALVGGVIGVSGWILRKRCSKGLLGILLVFLGVSLGLFAGLLEGAVLHEKTNNLTQEKGNDYYFEVVEDPRQESFGTYALAKIIGGSNEGLLVKVLFSASAPEVSYREIFLAHTNLIPLEGSAAEYSWQQGVVATARIFSLESLERTDAMGVVTKLRKQALACMAEYEGEGAALLRAILFADRGDLTKDGFYNAIRVTGLSHLVAVSGSHLVIVCAAWEMLLRCFRINRKGIVAVQVLFIMLYLVMTALPISAIRAAIMSSFALLSFFARRRTASLNAWSLCIMVMVLAAPSTALSVSFLLSVLSTLGIIVFASLFKGWCVRGIPRCPRVVSEGLSLTLAASLPLIPYSAALFSQISLISPLVNVIATPFFTVLCVGGLFVSFVCLILPAVGSFFFGFILVGAQGFSEIIMLAATVPYAAIAAWGDPLGGLVIGGGMLGLLWVWWPRASKKSIGCASASLVLLLGIVIGVVPLFSADEIIMLDVGQGDAFVVRSRGSTLLIDTGNHDSELLAGLGRFGIYHLDAVAISHADDDHCGSLDALYGVVQVDRVLLSAPTLSCTCVSCKKLLHNATYLVGDEKVKGVELNDQLQVGNFTLTVIWPAVFKEEGGNGDSLTLLLRAEGWGALFCGDMEAKQLAVLVNEGKVGDIDILKVGHHGARVALTAQILEVLRPEVSLISVGANNRYGHPAHETLTLLEEGGSKSLRSDEKGDVVCKLSPGVLEVLALG